MSSRIITLPPTTYSTPNPAYVWADQVTSLYYDNANTVNVGVSGNATSLPVVVTGATDAAAVIAQIQAATQIATANLTVVGNPGVPIATTALVATPESGQVALTWTNTDTRNQVQVWRSTTTGAETLYQTLPAATAAYTDIDVFAGTQYFYKVYTANVLNSTENTTGEVSATPTQPPAPDTLVATATGYYEVGLTWNPVAGAMSYKVYRGSIGGPYTAVGVSATASYTDAGIPAVAVEYVVTAIINNSESVYSLPADATPTALSAPVLTIGSATYALNLSWPVVAGATSYNIYRGTASGGESLAAQVTTNGYTDTPLSYTQGYFYYVTAVTNGVESPQSNEASATPANATFSGVSPQPASIAGGVLTFTGSGFDPSQAGVMAYGIAQASTLPVTYIDANTIQVYYPGGFSSGSVQFFYQVAGSYYQLPFTVAFA